MGLKYWFFIGTCEKHYFDDIFNKFSSTTGQKLSLRKMRLVHFDVFFSEDSEFSFKFGLGTGDIGLNYWFL